MISRKEFNWMSSYYNHFDKAFIDRLYEIKVHIDCNYSNIHIIVLDYILKNKLYNLPEYEIFNVFSQYNRYSNLIDFKKLENLIDSSQIIIYFEMIYNHYLENK